MLSGAMPTHIHKDNAYIYTHMITDAHQHRDIAFFADAYIYIYVYIYVCIYIYISFKINIYKHHPTRMIIFRSSQHLILRKTMSGGLRQGLWQIEVPKKPRHLTGVEVFFAHPKKGELPRKMWIFMGDLMVNYS